jgi:hypothetical protein
MGEIATPGNLWRRSSHSGGDNNCVEVVGTGVLITVRDSKDAKGGTLSFGHREWQAFVDDICRHSALS